MLRSTSLLLVLGMGTGLAVGQDPLPDKVVVTYVIYDDPDATTPVVEMEVDLWLDPQSRSGDDVTWEVDRVLVRDMTGSTVEDAWKDTSPTVTGTTWTVTHADADNIDNDDFVDPPVITGTASPEAGTTGDLDYDLEGLTYTPPQSGEHFTNKTGKLSYVFTFPSPTPELDNNDPVWVEPLEIGWPT